MTQNRDQQATVVGGTTEPDYQFPWVVAVSGGLTGRGVLIAPTWVLTAAHNVERSFGGAEVSYTRTDPNTGKVTGGRQATAVGSVHVHPNYVFGVPDFDLALVRLPAAFAPDPFLQPAALPAFAIVAGQVGTVASSFSHTTTLPPGHVAVLRAPIFPSGGPTFVARSPTASLCPGDSGSGVITANGGVNVAIGIAVETSVGDCTQPNREFGAVDVLEHVAWIRSTLGIFNAEIDATDGAGRLTRLRGYGNWRGSWHSIVPGSFGGDGHTDLLFYDRTAGYGEFYTTDGSGGIKLLRTQPNWRTTWDLIVPGHFGGSGSTDLLFYDRETGTGEFYATGGAELQIHANWRRSWDLIVPGDFGGDGHTDLLFYDRRAGLGEFYTTDGAGGITLLRSQTGWRTSWDMIVPGAFGGDARTDLLFYDRTAGQGVFYKTDGLGGMTQLQAYDGWRSTWTAIIAGNFADGSASDLLFYDRAAGWAEFLQNRGEARLSGLRAVSGWRTTWSQIVPGDFGSNGWTGLLFYEGPA